MLSPRHEVPRSLASCPGAAIPNAETVGQCSKPGRKPKAESQLSVPLSGDRPIDAPLATVAGSRCPQPHRVPNPLTKENPPWSRRYSSPHC